MDNNLTNTLLQDTTLFGYFSLKALKLAYKEDNQIAKFLIEEAYEKDDLDILEAAIYNLDSNRKLYMDFDWYKKLHKRFEYEKIALQHHLYQDGRKSYAAYR